MAAIGENNSSTEELSKITEQNENSFQNICTVSEFFAHKNIFLTGGTGFLGTVLIEELLDTHPDIGTIYVLVRGKRKLDPNQRISRLLDKPIFQKHHKKTLAKVVPVVGELSEVNFGFSEAILNELIEKVNVIYHSAATIKFSSPLRTAIKTNLTGTMRTIELAKKLKNLSAYIYLSTAFCNSNNRGWIFEEVYKSQFDPYDMMEMAEDDAKWEDFTDEKCKAIIRDHPNTYTFTKNLSENLLMAEMAGLPAAIVRPSIVYGTWEHPVKGWVGNVNSGHLGFLAGFVKGLFRTMSGSASSIVDIIPCDFVINSSLVMGWYVGTRQLDKPEVIHCTSGEVNPMTLGELSDIMNESVKRHPPNNFVWRPATKIRHGWRYNIAFFLFHLLPAMVYTIPEKLFGVGMKRHTAFEYMAVFKKGTKAFDYFMNKDFRYSFKNASRILAVMHESDKKRYNFDSSLCDWSEFIDRCLIGVRLYFFREAEETTAYHRMLWRIATVIHYAGYAVIFLILFGISTLLFGLPFGFTLALVIWSFVVWV